MEIIDIKKVVEVETKKSHDQYLMNLFDDNNMDNHAGGGCKRLWSYIKALSDQYEGGFTMEDISKILYKGSNPFASMKNIMVTIPREEKLTNKFKPNKALGPDVLPTTIIKDNGDILALILTIFSNNLLTLEKYLLIGPRLMSLPFSKRGIDAHHQITGQCLLPA